MTVDGVSYTDDVEPRTLLVQYLRDGLGKTGTLIGCDTTNCGACTVHLNGLSVKSCTVLAVQADGAEVTTIEGLASNGALHPVQQAFHESHALQCGFCTPGMIMQSVALLSENPDPSDEEIRDGLEGNLCRCTGYQNIVKAVRQAAGMMPMTVTEERPETTLEVGQARLRKEDQRLITGRTRCTDNITLPGMLHLGLVRSPMAHAKITSIDVAEAKTAPGVVAVYTGADLADDVGPMPCGWPLSPDDHVPAYQPVAVDEVNFAGEIVAVVVARSAAAARDAAELVDVDYEDLPVVLDIEAAAAGRSVRPSRLRDQRLHPLGLRLRRGRHRHRRRGRDRQGARATASSWSEPSCSSG